MSDLKQTFSGNQPAKEFKKADYWFNVAIKVKDAKTGEVTNKKVGKTGIAMYLDRKVDKLLIEHMEASGGLDGVEFALSIMASAENNTDEIALVVNEEK